MLRRRSGAHARVVLTVVVAALALSACVPSTSPAPSGGLKADIYTRHNKTRTSFKLPGFARDAGMDGHAQSHANRLLQSSPNACRLFHSTELAVWYAGHWAAENVACIGGAGCPTNGAQVMDLWIKSVGHRANILNRSYRSIGVGTACNGRVSYAVTQFRS